MSLFLTSFNRFSVIAIIASLCLGQLTRFTLTPQIAFYFHDLIILLFIIINFFPSLPLLRFPSITRRHVLLLLALFFLILLSWSLNFPFTLTPVLYTCRFLVYLIFLLLFYFIRPFTLQELRTIIITFFLAFIFLGFFQYLFFPDTRLLAHLGWDDHYYRLIGTWFDPAFTSLVFVFAFIFYHFTLTSKYPPHFSWFIYSLLFIALILTSSRSSLLALVCLILTYLLVARSSRSKNSLALAKKHTLIPLIFLFFTASVFTLVTSRLQNSVSFSFLRPHSIVIRLQTFATHLTTLTPKDWLLGHGLFTPLPTPTLTSTSALAINSSWKQTASFPDNFFLLLISFFGLPATIIIVFHLYRFFRFILFYSPPIFYLALALLINAQFNQAVFQPFVLLLFGLLFIYFYRRPQSSGYQSLASTHKKT